MTLFLFFLTTFFLIFSALINVFQNYPRIEFNYAMRNLLICWFAIYIVPYLFDNYTNLSLINVSFDVNVIFLILKIILAIWFICLWIEYLHELLEGESLFEMLLKSRKIKKN